MTVTGAPKWLNVRACVITSTLTALGIRSVRTSARVRPYRSATSASGRSAKYRSTSTARCRRGSAWSAWRLATPPGAPPRAVRVHHDPPQVGVRVAVQPQLRPGPVELVQARLDQVLGRVFSVAGTDLRIVAYTAAAGSGAAAKPDFMRVRHRCGQARELTPARPSDTAQVRGLICDDSLLSPPRRSGAGKFIDRCPHTQ